MMRFTESHEWIQVEEGIGTVGITDCAQKELGEVVYVELPPLGKYVKAGDEIAVLESTKAAVDVYSPVSGKIVEVNQKLKCSIYFINASAESEGWLFRIQLADPGELDLLLTLESYAQN
jgi:glycine cleavage system H protein